MNRENRYPVSHRDKLKVAGAVGVGVIAAIGDIYRRVQSGKPFMEGIIDLAKTIPEREEEEMIPYPYPGWLETGLPERPPLLNAQNGAAQYLRYILLHSDVLKKATRYANKELMNSDAPSIPPKLGDMLTEHISAAKRALEEEYSDQSASVSNQIHIAMHTLSAMISPYFTPDELKNLGCEVSQEVGEGKTQYNWQSIFKDYIPGVLPIQREAGISEEDFLMRYKGSDRAVHAFQHAFACYQYVYASDNNLSEKNSMPFALWLTLELFHGTPEQKARLQSLLIGTVWEFQETGEFLKEYVRGELDSLPSGFADDKVGYDLAANAFGANFGIRLSKPELKEEELDGIIKYMNDPKWYTS